MKRIIYAFLLSIFITPVSAQSVTTFSVFFNTAKDKLTGSEFNQLKSQMKNFDTVKITKITLTGYCDDVGDEEYNQDLSSRRAQSIRKLLSEFQFNESALIVVRWSGELPLIKSTDKSVEEQRTENRRVDVMVDYETIKREVKEIVEVIEEVEEIKPVEKEILTDNQEVGDKITLENLLFEGGRHVLLYGSGSDKVLEKLVATLKKHKEYHIRILGYICCQPVGTDGLDWDTGKRNLSEARARMVYDFLIENGISKKRLSYKGLGSQPTGKGDMYDRRVEIEIKDIIKSP